MANPAELLHDQLAEWSKSDPLSKTRQLTTDEGWSRQRIAAVNLDHVMTLLDMLDKEGQNTAPWRKYTTELHQAVFGFGTDWDSFGGRQLKAGNPVDEHALNTLQMLVMVTGHLIPRLEDDGVQQLQDMLSDEILQQPAEAFPYDIRAYFIRVRDHLAWCVAHFDEVGEFSLHEAAMQFRMTVQFMAAGAPEGERSKWRSFVAERLVWPFISTTVTTYPAAQAAHQLGEFGGRIMELISGS